MRQFRRLVLLVGTFATAQKQTCRGGGGDSEKACEADQHVKADEDGAGLLQVAVPRAAKTKSTRQSPGGAADLVQALQKYQAMPPRKLEALVQGTTQRFEPAALQIPTCRFGALSDCPMSTLTTSGFTAVMPEPKIWGTSCMDRWSPFVFQVYPGHSDKLLLYFQDGGACWDLLSSVMPFAGQNGLCNRAIKEQDPVGIFDRAQDNPYKDFTVVHVNYCSGDAHAGNAVHRYGRQSGYNNTRAAIEWVKQNLAKGLDHIAIMGASAGSLGAQVWARTVLTDFKTDGRSYQSAAVVSDSYLGFFPPGTQPRVMDSNLGICSTPVGQGWSKTCGQDLTLQDAVDDEIGMFPDVAFLFINSKADSIQGHFYAAIAFTLLGQFQFLTADDLYKEAIIVLERYSKHPNSLAFQLDGEHHVFLNRRRCSDPAAEDCEGDMYSATSRGPLEALMRTNNVGSGPPKIFEWLRSSVQQRGTMQSQCNGVLKVFQQQAPFPTSYCDRKLSQSRIQFDAK